MPELIVDDEVLELQSAVDCVLCGVIDEFVAVELEYAHHRIVNALGRAAEVIKRLKRKIGGETNIFTNLNHI